MSKDKREITSSITHLAAAALALLGTIWLTVRAVRHGDASRLISELVFGVSMVFLYSMSTAYHWIDEAKERAKLAMRRIDHIAIFVLIAGTYTPVCVLTLGGPVGYFLLAAVWGVALIGLFIKIFWMDAPQWLSCGLYVAMGWLIVCDVVPLFRSLPAGGLVWLIAGGVIYTIGAFIYGLKKPNLKISWFGSHELFHLFVIGGSVCHFVTVLCYV
ncbi:MAG: hemolysin III family protein [Synergistaceae bacterium]|nr:hemolysin III family protein [Synergistaceae bacterium]